MAEADAEHGRTHLEREVAARCVHTTAESVRTTCSFALAERLLAVSTTVGFSSSCSRTPLTPGATTLAQVTPDRESRWSSPRSLR